MRLGWLRVRVARHHQHMAIDAHLYSMEQHPATRTCCGQRTHTMLVSRACTPASARLLDTRRVAFTRPRRAAPKAPSRASTGSTGSRACYLCRQQAAASRLVPRARGTALVSLTRAAAGSYAAVVEDTTADEAALAAFLDTLKFDANGLLVASAQDVDTGAILMQVLCPRILRNPKIAR